MYSGFNLKINAERDCGPDSINFLGVYRKIGGFLFGK